MDSVQKPFNIKLIFFVLAMVSIIMVFGVNRLMISQLRNEARQQVEYLAKSYSDAINSDNEEDIRFVMDILLPSLNFPIIITSSNEISAAMNLNITAEPGSTEYIQDAWKIIEQMDEIFQPLDLKWDEMQWGKIHFADPQVVAQLRWMPYIEIGFGIIFVIISLWGFQLFRQGEKNMIYAGMARETAHQLGTPISSLMGWMKLLRDQKSDTSSILSAMDDDISRLSEISERFSKIGSNPKLKTITIYDLLSKSINYMQNRLPKYSKIGLILEGNRDIRIQGDWILFRWAIENILKNSIDAIGPGGGNISVNIESKKKYSSILITDSGKGISRKDWKNIFLPGFSSKRRGWGLGLSLTMRIIKEIHQGDIRVLRSKPGETVFQIMLHLEQA